MENSSGVELTYNIANRYLRHYKVFNLVPLQDKIGYNLTHIAGISVDRLSKSDLITLLLEELIILVPTIKEEI